MGPELRAAWVDTMPQPSPRRSRGHQESLCPESHLQLQAETMHQPPQNFLEPSPLAATRAHSVKAGSGWEDRGFGLPLCPLSEAWSCPAPMVLLSLCPRPRHIPMCYPQPSSELALTCGCGRDSMAVSWSRFPLRSLCAAPGAERAWKFTKFFSTKSPSFSGRSGPPLLLSIPLNTLTSSIRYL